MTGGRLSLCQVGNLAGTSQNFMIRLCASITNASACQSWKNIALSQTELRR